jgi:multiple sugar transport system substrate-binding protein
MLRAMPRVLLALVLLASALGGCDAAGAPERPTVLNVFMADDWASAPAVSAAVRTFEDANDGVRVRVTGMPFQQIPEAVRASVEGGEPVDVAHWHAFAAAAQGLAQPLDDLWADHLDPDEFLPGAYGDVTWGEEIFGVPLDTNAMLLLTNADLLADAGVAPDDLATFDDLRAAAERLASAGTTALSVPANSWTTYGWIRANGGELLEVAADGDVTFTLDHPQVVEALDLLGELVRNDQGAGPDARNAPEDASALFRARSTAMHTSGTWDVTGIEADEPDWDLVVRPVPVGATDRPTGTALGGSSLFVASGSANRELAFRFMTTLIEDDTARRLLEEEGRLPARRRLLDDPYFDTPTGRVVATELERADPMRLIAFPAAADAFAIAIEDVLLGERTAAEALAIAQDEARRSLAAMP